MLVAADLDAVAGELRAAFGLGEPFADPGVGAFGLRNAVFAIGDCFLEVVSPVEPGTTAGRYLERRGSDGGYMVIFQLGDLESARARVQEMGIRIVWQLDLPDISGTHLHPADIGGAIVSLDRAEPPGSWRWGGPDWTERVGTGAPGRLEAVTLAVPDPAAAATRWGAVLGVEADDGALALDGGSVAFTAGDAGLVEIGLALADDVRRGRESVEIGGARFVLSAL